MVRSNFDYTNRPSSGEKLGASIASDLWKKAAQPAKIVKPSSKTSRTLSTPSPEDPSEQPSGVVQTRLDIKIPDKTLTDAGWVLIAEALAAALKARPDLALTDLDLAGNDLTVASLVSIAQVLALAPALQTLDLSRNRISVQSAYDEADFEPFIRVCWYRPDLRHLDLSGNLLLGARAFEIMARVSTTPIPALTTSRRDSQQQEPRESESGASQDDDTKPQSSIASVIRKSPKKSLRSRRRAASGLQDSGAADHGQPGGRTIALNGVDMDDEAVLFLADTVNTALRHGLVVFISYGRNSNSLSKDDVHLLSLIGDQSTNFKATGHIPPSQADEISMAMGLEDASHKSPGRPSRARGTPSGGSAAEELSPASEDLSRTRKKIQRNIIVKNGYAVVELWAAAMEVFTMSRGLYLLAPSSASTQHIGTTAENHTSAHSDQTTATSITALDTNAREPGRSIPPKSKLSERKVSLSRTFAEAMSDLTADAMLENDPPALEGASFGPDLFTVKPSSPNELRRRRRKRIATIDFVADESPDDDVLPPAPIAIRPAINASRDRYRNWQHARMKETQNLHGGASNGYEDSSLKSRLPLPVCQQILALTVDERSVSLLSKRQQRKALEWGQLHDSLHTEYDWRNKDRASQIWMLLETLECLEYE